MQKETILAMYFEISFFIKIIKYQIFISIKNIINISLLIYFNMKKCLKIYILYVCYIILINVKNITEIVMACYFELLFIVVFLILIN